MVGYFSVEKFGNAGKLLYFCNMLQKLFGFDAAQHDVRTCSYAYGATNLPDALIVKGTATGINTIQVSDAKTDDGYYNLAGQRVNADFKGIVIHHGKKMLKK